MSSIHKFYAFGGGGNKYIYSERKLSNVDADYTGGPQLKPIYQYKQLNKSLLSPTTNVEIPDTIFNILNFSYIGCSSVT
uniref:Uncharacterized protein n=1 Tax=Arundo donax TaxID=35708 RepID=A0A0A9CM82_ARUDO